MYELGVEPRGLFGNPGSMPASVQGDMLQRQKNEADVENQNLRPGEEVGRTRLRQEVPQSVFLKAAATRRSLKREEEEEEEASRRCSAWGDENMKIIRAKDEDRNQKFFMFVAVASLAYLASFISFEYGGMDDDDDYEFSG